MSSKLPTVYRAERSGRVYVTFEGLRESRTIADKLTRIRIAMPATTARGLYQLLGAVTSDQVEQ